MLRFARFWFGTWGAGGPELELGERFNFPGMACCEGYVTVGTGRTAKEREIEGSRLFAQPAKCATLFGISGSSARAIRLILRPSFCHFLPRSKVPYIHSHLYR